MADFFFLTYFLISLLYIKPLYVEIAFLATWGYIALLCWATDKTMVLSGNTSSLVITFCPNNIFLVLVHLVVSYARVCHMNLLVIWCHHVIRSRAAIWLLVELEPVRFCMEIYQRSSIQPQLQTRPGTRGKPQLCSGPSTETHIYHPVKEGEKD